VPAHGLDDDELFAYLRRVAFELSAYPGHPMFMGYISGAGTPPGVAATLIAAGLNQNVGGFRLAPSATEIERKVAAFFAARFGLPRESAGGTVVSGGALATLSALKVARDQCACADVKSYGVSEAGALAVYASGDAHAVVTRALDVLGLGRQALHVIPVDDRQRMQIGELQQAIAADRSAGCRPVAVVATAGTTATGAIDPLDAIADICHEHAMWMHVDAAYGGAAALSKQLAPLLAGIERADSIAFDPHKWMGIPLGSGLVLYRRVEEAYDSYHIDASYTVEDTERTGSTFDYGSHGLQWSRPFESLKIWVSLLAYGTEAWGRRIEHDVELAHHLAAQITARPDFELVTPPSLSICCFRYLPPSGESSAAVDELNARLMTESQIRGRSYCSNAVVDGRFALRACIVNFRTEAEHVDRMLDDLSQLGAELHAASGRD
jgi:glutamate/tyrosine decarboxylase-like PLP-dependent enzyme